MTTATAQAPCRACEAVPARPAVTHAPREAWRNAMALDLLERLLGEYGAAALQLLDAAAIAAAGNNNELALRRLRTLDELIARALLKRLGPMVSQHGAGEETPA